MIIQTVNGIQFKLISSHEEFMKGKGTIEVLSYIGIADDNFRREVSSMFESLYEGVWDYERAVSTSMPRDISLKLQFKRKTNL